MMSADTRTDLDFRTAPRPPAPRSRPRASKARTDPPRGDSLAKFGAPRAATMTAESCGHQAHTPGVALRLRPALYL